MTMTHKAENTAEENHDGLSGYGILYGSKENGVKHKLKTNPHLGHLSRF